MASKPLYPQLGAGGEGDAPGEKQSLEKENGALLGENGVLQEPQDTTPKREHWGKKIDFLLSCIGFAVGLGNVWRFPYLCYKNGGGAFLIPYFVCLIAGGVPVFILEISLGQFMQKGGYGIWNICPLSKGIGIATAIIASLCNIYYIVILAWDLYYLAMSFTSELPWASCDNYWNTDRCRISFNKVNCSLEDLSNVTGLSDSVISACVNVTRNETAEKLMENITYVDPVVEFWEKRILQISPGVDEPQGLVWQLTASLAVCWIMCYFCIWKGVKWTGKVVYFTATFPYMVLTILMIRGVTLDGATNGLWFYLKPEWSRLADVQIWIDAGTQIFFSYAIALGAMAALGSYNKFNNNCYRDCVIIATVNSFSSLYAGVVIFSVLGFMAKQQGVDISDVAESGPGLAFIAYPKAVTQMPFAPLWAVLFFVMIIFLGLDTQFVAMEAVITVIVDQFPKLRKPGNKETFVAIYCIISFIVGLPMVTHGGMYVFQLFDYYSASGMALLWVCFFETSTIAWIYGGGRFYDNIEMMIGYRINPWLRICWTALTPLMTAGIFIAMWASFKVLTYNRTYEYPWWAQGLGMCLAFSSMIWIPIIAIYQLATTPGTFRERWTKLTTPIYPDHVVEANREWKHVKYELQPNGNKC